MRRSIIIAACVTVAVGGLTALAPAAGARDVSKADKHKAKYLFRKGGRAYRKKNYKKAVKYLLEAYSIWPRREMLFNIASAFGKLGDKIKAVTYLRGFIKDANPKELATIPSWLRDIQDEVAVIKVLGVDGATVKMDGKDMGKIPVRLVILPGMHLFVVEKDGQRIVKRDWDVKPGLRRVWEVTPPQDRPPPRRVEPRIIVKPVIVRQPAVTQTDKPRQGISVAFFATTAALAVGLAGGAVATGLRANKLHKEYVANPTVDGRNQGLQMRNITNALIGVSGAMAATAVVLAIFTQWKKAPKESAEKKASFDLGAGSFMVRGRF